MLIWRKREFIEFMTFRPWMLTRRRVNEIPAYLYPIGLGFSWVSKIRQGFWIDGDTGELYVGFLSGGDNFHYFSLESNMRSSAEWPLPGLSPISFEEAFLLLMGRG